MSAVARVAALKKVDFPVLGFPMTPSSREYPFCMVSTLEFLVWYIVWLGALYGLCLQFWVLFWLVLGILVVIGFGSGHKFLRRQLAKGAWGEENWPGNLPTIQPFHFFNFVGHGNFI